MKNKLIAILLAGCLVLGHGESVCALVPPFPTSRKASEEERAGLAPESGFTRTNEWKPRSLEDLVIPEGAQLWETTRFSIGFATKGKDGKDYWVKFSNRFFIQNEWDILKICMSADSRIVRAVAMGEDIEIREFAYSSDWVSDVRVRVRGGPYIIFEKLEGKCLTGYMLENRYSISQEEQLDIARQSAEIMMAVHGAGIIHRDFAMRNLWREPSGRIRLLDFALSWDINTPIPSFMDELWFFPKESERCLKEYNGSPDKQYDIFSFGVFLVELFRNVILFNESDLNRNITSLAVANPGLANIVIKCIANRKIRYTDFSEVLRDLNRLILGEDGKRAVSESA